MMEKISRARALEIAAADAVTVYGSLDAYHAEVEREGGNWRIRYRLKDPEAQGGGASYVISAATGEFLSRLYEQ